VSRACLLNMEPFPTVANTNPSRIRMRATRQDIVGNGRQIRRSSDAHCVFQTGPRRAGIAAADVSMRMTPPSSLHTGAARPLHLRRTTSSQGQGRCAQDLVALLPVTLSKNKVIADVTVDNAK
jgi:hypothetical protein